MTPYRGYTELRCSTSISMLRTLSLDPCPLEKKNTSYITLRHKKSYIMTATAQEMLNTIHIAQFAGNSKQDMISYRQI